MEVVIVAPVKVKPEYLEQFTQAMHVVLATSREEPGCLQYDVHREIDSANSFVFTSAGVRMMPLLSMRPASIISFLVNRLTANSNRSLSANFISLHKFIRF